MKKIIFQHHKQTNYISKSNSLWSHQWQRKDVACPVSIQYSFKTYTYHKQLFLVVNYHLFSKKPKSFVNCSKLYCKVTIFLRNMQLFAHLFCNQILLYRSGIYYNHPFFQSISTSFLLNHLFPFGKNCMGLFQIYFKKDWWFLNYHCAAWDTKRKLKVMTILTTGTKAINCSWSFALTNKTVPLCL